MTEGHPDAQSTVDTEVITVGRPDDSPKSSYKRPAASHKDIFEDHSSNFSSWSAPDLNQDPIPATRKYKTWLKFIHVVPHLTPVNLFGFLFAALFAICAQASLSTLQASFLDTVIGLTKDLGQATGDLGFYEQLFSVPMSAICGVISDWLGRRIVFSAGFIFL